MVATKGAVRASRTNNVSMDFALEPRPSMHLEIVPVLREMILTGVLAEGTPIKEAELCQRLGVSKTPLREALKVLAYDHWVELSPNRGATVTKVTIEEAANLFEILEGFEAMVGTLAAKKISDVELRTLEKLQEKLGQSLKQLREREYFDTSQAIHNLILQCTRKDQLIAMHENVSQRIRRARITANLSAERRSASYDEHVEILEAAKARDGRKLSSALKRHAAETGKAVIAALKARG